MYDVTVMTVCMLHRETCIHANASQSCYTVEKEKLVELKKVR